VGGILAGNGSRMCRRSRPITHSESRTINRTSRPGSSTSSLFSDTALR